MNRRMVLRLIGTGSAVLLAGCGGGESDSGSVGSVDDVGAYPDPTREEAFLFLQQSSFGPTPALVSAVQSKGIEGWIDEQISQPSAYYGADSESATTNFASQVTKGVMAMAEQAEPSKQRWMKQFHMDDKPQTWNRTGDWLMPNYMASVMLGEALNSKEQLRLRVANALSQIVVTSISAEPLDRRAEALSAYYDMLAANAFGNYRDLMSDVARSPAMGVYLSHQGNKKYDAATQTHPDENFARELLQLFTIGLYQLNLDGTVITSNDLPLPAYTQRDVEELAKVMTGWDLYNNNLYGESRYFQGDYSQPMEVNHASGGSGAGSDDFHEYGPKNLLGQTIASGLSVEEDLEAALDIIFSQANVAPFIAKNLILRLVKSNPTPAYVARVASVFNDNGDGIKGDMSAVLKAVLLDQEARTSSTQMRKAKEPYLAFTQYLRNFNAQPLPGWQSHEGIDMSGYFWLNRFSAALPPLPMFSPSVFNFYQNDFHPVNNAFAPAEVAPELQLYDESLITNQWRLFYNTIPERNVVVQQYGSIEKFVDNQRGGNYHIGMPTTALVDYSEELQLLEQAIDGDSDGDFRMLRSAQMDANGYTPLQSGLEALIEHLDGKLFGGDLPESYKQNLMEELPQAGVVVWANYNTERKAAIELVQTTVMTLVTSKYYNAQY
ncbi:DUF1800 domain-containing protein [Vibrio sp.]|uniref:DUF1800 domain-containing protein n=1 Tax=Vibrio sp. TaxID=678 RepID=UPI003D0B3650